MYASDKHSIAICDRCGFQVKHSVLRELVVNKTSTNLFVCSSCWEPDQPQLQVGKIRVVDPQVIKNPRADSSYIQSGLTGLQRTLTDVGDPAGGSRQLQWGWNPVGFNNQLGLSGLESTLQASTGVGSVLISIGV